MPAMLILEDGNSVFFRPHVAQGSSALNLFGKLSRGSYFESMAQLMEALPNWVRPDDVRSAMKYEVLKPRFVSLRADETFPNLRMRIIGPMRNFEDYQVLPPPYTPTGEVFYAHLRKRHPEQLADAVMKLMERAQTWGTDVTPGWAARSPLRFTKVPALPEESGAGGYREAAVSNERILARDRSRSTWSRFAGRILRAPVADESVLTEHGLYLKEKDVWFVPLRPSDIQILDTERLLLGQCLMVYYPNGVSSPVFERLAAWARGEV